jgi:hypothetical protein
LLFRSFTGLEIREFDIISKEICLVAQLIMLSVVLL